MATQRKGRRLWLISGGAMAFLVIVGLWLQWRDADPVVTIPTVKMPSPNGYDFCVRAFAAMVAAPTPVDPVIDTVVPPTDPRLLKLRYPLAAKQAWLQRNSRALTLLRQSFAYPFQQHRDANVLNAFPVNARLREMARMLVVDCHAREEQGDWNGASQSALDIIQMATAWPRGGTVMTSLVGSATSAIGDNELWRIVPHLNAPGARAATQRLWRIEAARVPLSDIMRQEKYTNQPWLLRMWREPHWRGEIFEDQPLLQSWRVRLKMQLIPKRTIMSNYTRAMDAAIENAQRPYQLSRPFPAAADPLSSMAATDYSLLHHGVEYNAARHDASEDLLLVALALRAYRLDTGAYPSQLAALVLRYLKAVPRDAFGTGGPLLYRRTAHEYVLWSVGPDGVDNGGKPVVHTQSKTRSRYLVRPDDKGDMVAGINS